MLTLVRAPGGGAGEFPGARRQSVAWPIMQQKNFVLFIILCVAILGGWMW
jgi:hypothetical protein